MLLAVALISDPDVYSGSHDFDLYHLICVLFFGVCFRIGTAAKSDARTAAETPAYSPGTDRSVLFLSIVAKLTSYRIALVF
jgi:hypothetical protein